MGLGVRGTKGLPIAGGRGDPVKLRYLGKPVTSAGLGRGTSLRAGGSTWPSWDPRAPASRPARARKHSLTPEAGALLSPAATQVAQPSSPEALGVHRQPRSRGPRHLTSF